MKGAVQVFEAFSNILADAYDQVAEDESEKRKLLSKMFENLQGCGLDAEEMEHELWNDDIIHLLDPGLLKADIMEGIDELAEKSDENAGNKNFEAKRINMNKEELTMQLEEMEGKMSTDQLKAFKSVQDMVEQYTKAQATGIPYRGVPLFISGPGGTGKSFLLEAIKISIHLKVAKNVDDLVVTVVAPTGAVAVNIDGDTIHHAFSLPVQQKYGGKVVMQLSDKKKQEMYTQYQDLVAVLMDEVSMCSSDLLYMLHVHLNQVMGVTNLETTFGGLIMILWRPFSVATSLCSKGILASKCRHCWEQWQLLEQTCGLTLFNLLN